MQQAPRNTGWLEVICGPMFSGKTEELIRRVQRALYARQSVQVFKPKIDRRYDAVQVVSHTRQRLVSVPVADAAELLAKVRPEADVIAIDEIQFFGAALTEACEALANMGKRVICAGLDLDFRGSPFEPTPHLAAKAESVTKLLAICMVCGGPASRTQRTAAGGERIVVGATEAYEARCRRCHVPEAAEPAPPQPLLLFSLDVSNS